VTSLRLLGQPCTIRYHSPGELLDAANNPNDAWTEVASRCSVQMRARGETGLMGDLSNTLWLVFLPPDVTPPRSPDQLVVQDQTLEFVGDSWPAYLMGRLDHIEATATVANENLVAAP
jgi:hypothetical protein